ncbi:MAG: dihydroorotate dehydrogenase-like protein [Geminicoccaceae bacterium]
MDLRTRYLGLELKHPLVASASPISRTLDGIKRLEDGNAAAIVLSSLFEEHCQRGADVDEAFGPDAYLDLIRRAVDATDVPIIASLNGITDRGWTTHAKAISDAGAAALELNVYYIPADLETTSAEVEQRYVDVLKSAKHAVNIPVAMKLSPYFSAFGAMARRLVDEGGADGLVLFNRFYQPDIDLAKLTVLPTLELSEPHEARLPLLWIAVLCRRVQASIAATTGVHRPEQVIKYLLAGADVVMTTSSLLKEGPQHMADLLRGLAQWMHDRDYTSVDRIRGALSHSQAADPTAFVRTNYVDTLKG